MSAGSFDDSSNLVDVASHSNGEQKAESLYADKDSKEKQGDLLDEPIELEEVKETDSKPKSKKSKAKKLFKRAKSPISGAINKTTKEFKKLSNLPKHHYSVPKSPQKSPSKENLTEEYKHLEDKISEKSKGSEEWMAFQQMQDRIKQTVLKTQTSLNKYSSHSEDEDQKITNWTAFDEETEEVIDTTLRTGPAINVSCTNNGSGHSEENLLEIEQPQGKGRAPSPPAPPGPPVSSRISSMDNLTQDTDKSVDTSKTENPESVDFLGLLGDSSSTVPDFQPVSDTLKQDLLGLDRFLEPTPSTNVSGAEEPGDTGSQVLSGYTFTASVSGETQMEISSSEPVKTDFNDILMFEQPMTEDQLLGMSSKGQTPDPVQMVTESQSVEQDVFQLEPSDVEAAPLQPVPALQPVTVPLEPIKSSPDYDMESKSDVLEPEVFSLSNDQVVPSGAVEESSGLDDFDSFDPMKSTGAQGIPTAPVQSTYNPFQAVPDGQMYGSSPQMSAQSYSSVPIEHDIMSKIRKMSSSNQPISPARKMVSKPVDPFGFVKKELGTDEDDGTYKSMADLQTFKQKEPTQDVLPEDQPVDESLSNANNPFLSGDFNEDFSNKEISENAAAVFGVDTESFNFEANAAPASDLGAFLGGTEEDLVKPEWTDVSAVDDTSNMWGDSDVLDSVSSTSAWDTTTKSDQTMTGDVWGSEKKDEVVPEGGSNPFQQDDFSKLDDIPMEESKEATVNPFLSGDSKIDAPAVTSSVNNPFLNMEDQSGSVDPVEDLLGPKPVMLSDSESFFMDSVHEPHQVVEETDDLFDPFKVKKKETSESTTQQIDVTDALDAFSAVAASGDKQLAKPSEDDHGFMLEIKPATSGGSEKPTSLPAPILKPPPKPPKSPQPPRENPFDRESPPEENFAQFEVKENEKPKEPPPKSLSTDSTTTEEETEQQLEPLEPYLPKTEKEGFKLMLRYPTKKKIAGNRYWKNVFVKIQKQSEGPMVKVFSDAKDALPMQDLLLQACYSLSDICLQQYDQYGKIHAVKLQYVFYKERVGIKTERIAPSIVKLKKREKPKATMILDHSPQVSELLKFGSLDKAEIILFMQAIEDALMNLEAHREKTLTYTKDEITAEVRDEYMAELDKFGKVLSQKARVRIFVLAFLTGMPTVEVGLNDKRRRGKEVVGRCDIIPIKTEEWIRLEGVEFHHCVDKEEFEKTNNIKFHPLDACQFELLRYRVRLRENKELPLQLTVQQIFKERKCEIRCDLLVTGYHSYSKKHGQFPCEDIEVHFPIPEQWIYMFRYERRFGYGSIHSSLRKPGKIKGLERITMMAQGLSQTLMEADVGTAKYEHVYRAVVWRIPRLPVRNQGAYTSHLFKLKLDLGPHDEIPEKFEQTTHVEFTMPCSTTSQSQIRSIAVTNPNPPEKWVRSMAKYYYTIGIEHLDEYPEIMTVGTVYKEAATTNTTKSDEEKEPEERDPRLAVSDTDSSDSD